MRNHDHRSVSLVHDLLAGAAEDDSGMTPRSATSHDKEICLLFACRSEKRRHGVAVDHHTAVDHRRIGEWSAPLLLEQGSHLDPLPLRRYDRSVAEVCQEAQGVHRDDLPASAFDEGRCPREGAGSIVRAIDANDDAIRRGHVFSPCMTALSCANEDGRLINRYSRGLGLRGGAHLGRELGEAVGVAPFVVVPAEYLHQSSFDHRELSIEHTRGR